MFNKNFFLLWSGALVSKLGDKFYGIALAWWILQKTKSPVMMGLMMVASVLPGLLIGPFAGALIDKWPRKPFIILPDILRGLVVIGVTIMSAQGVLEIWQVVLAAMLLSLNAAFFDPTVQAVIPQIVPEHQLPKANALNQMVNGASTVIGPILGSLAVNYFGFTYVFLMNGLSYLISAWCQSFIRIPSSVVIQQDRPTLAADLREGFRYLKGQKNVMIVMGIIGIAHFFVGGLFVTMPFLANTLAGKGVQNLGVLETMLGVGLILGSIYINIKKKSDLNEQTLFILMAGVGGCFISIGFFSHLQLSMVYPYMALLGVVGMAISNASVYWQSILQRSIPQSMAGRIFSLSNMIGNISMPIAFGGFGFLLNRFSMGSLMLVSGFSLLGVIFVLMFVYSEKRENTQTSRAGI